MLCLQSDTCVLILDILSAHVCSYCGLWQNAVHSEYLDGALITDKKLRVDQWILLTLTGHHVVYVAEGTRPEMHFHLVKWRLRERSCDVGGLQQVALK